MKRKRLNICLVALALGATVSIGFSDIPAIRDTSPTPGESMSTPFAPPSTEEAVGRPHWVHIPPFPPPYGSELPLRIAGKKRYAFEFQDFYWDHFYPGLAGRLIHKRLGRGDERKVAEYLEARTQAQRQLRNRIGGAESTEAERETLSKRMAWIETRAEELRADLCTDDYDWNSLRKWRLGDGRRTYTLQDTAAVVAATAFFEGGLSLHQRDMLRVLALEMVPGKTAAADDEAGNSFVWFSPFGARINRTVLIGKGVDGQIAEFEKRLALVKNDLLHAVRQNDRLSESRRLAAYKALAKKQEPELRALDALAEEIRKGVFKSGSTGRWQTRAPEEPADAAASDDYYDAALQPGLTLSERRILFESAVARWTKARPNWVLQAVD